MSFAQTLRLDTHQHVITSNSSNQPSPSSTSTPRAQLRPEPRRICQWSLRETANKVASSVLKLVKWCKRSSSMSPTTNPEESSEQENNEATLSPVPRFVFFVQTQVPVQDQRKAMDVFSAIKVTTMTKPNQKWTQRLQITDY